jgi:hypothetical protein
MQVVMVVLVALDGIGLLAAVVVAGALKGVRHIPVTSQALWLALILLAGMGRLGVRQ